MADGHLLLVALTDERAYDLVRDAVVDLDLPLVRIEPRRHSLEDLFRDQGGRSVTEPTGTAADGRQRAPAAASTTSATRAITAIACRVARWSWRCSPRRCVACYGIGRGARAKVVPFALAGLALIPAIVAVGIAASSPRPGRADRAWHASRPSSTTRTPASSRVFVMLFCAAQAPELFGRDQRYGVLPLYFSRALARTDYAVARTGGLVVGLLLMVLAPQLLLFAGRLLTAADPGTGWQLESPNLLPALLQALLTVLLLGGIACGHRVATRRAAPMRPRPSSPCSSSRRSSPTLVDEHRTRRPGHATPSCSARGTCWSTPTRCSSGRSPTGPTVFRASLPDAAFYIAVALIGIAVTFGLTIRRYQRIAA